MRAKPKTKQKTKQKATGVHAIRLANLLGVIAGRRIADFATEFGLSEKYIRLVQHGHSMMGGRFARQVEQACDKPSGWMDAPSTPSLSASFLALRYDALPSHWQELIAAYVTIAEEDQRRFA